MQAWTGHSHDGFLIGPDFFGEGTWQGQPCGAWCTEMDVKTGPRTMGHGVLKWTGNWRKGQGWRCG